MALQSTKSPSAASEDSPSQAAFVDVVALVTAESYQKARTETFGGNQAIRDQGVFTRTPPPGVDVEMQTGA